MKSHITTLIKAFADRDYVLDISRDKAGFNLAKLWHRDRPARAYTGAGLSPLSAAHAVIIEAIYQKSLIERMEHGTI